MYGSPYAAEKRRSLVSLALALVVMLMSVRAVGTPWAIIALPVTLVAVWVASAAFGTLIRLAAVEREVLGRARAEFVHEFRRSSLPQQVFWLLLAVAEADGAVGPRERDLVREFLLLRFTDPAHIADLQEWEAAAASERRHPDLLARSLASILTPAERETVFFWACLVAFIDGRYRDQESEVLQVIARGFGLRSEHARRVFWHAKHAYLGQDDSRRSQGSRREAPWRREPVDARHRAFELLGLPVGADRETIRGRHRELVKKFHPDRHQHLGKPAAEEAAARFREVQQAYELLTS